MTLKAKMSLLVFLTSLSIVSIGFSSWSITAETTAEINGNIEVDNVINSDDYIRLDTTKGYNNTGVDCFKYQDYGYLNSEGTSVTDTGYIRAYFVLDVEKCYQLLAGDYEKLKIDFKLGYTDNTLTSLNLFKYYITEEGYQDISSTFSCNYDGISISSSEIMGNDMLYSYSEILIFNNLFDYYKNNNSIKTIDFCVEYALFASTGDFFYDNIFKYLYMDMINVVNFKIEVEISGV